MTSKEESLYYAYHPPRCLENVAASLFEDTLPPQLGCHGECIESQFRLTCTCGQDAVYVLGQYGKNEAYFIDPFALECPDCGKIHEFFNVDTDGYSHEGNTEEIPQDRCGFNSEDYEEFTCGGIFTLVKYACAHCGNQLTFSVFPSEALAGEPKPCVCGHLMEIKRKKGAATKAKKQAALLAKKKKARVKFKCATCGPVLLEIFVTFWYFDSLFEESGAEFGGHEEDLFSSFAIRAKCSTCGKFQEVSLTDCAEPG